MRSWGVNYSGQATVPNRFTADGVIHAGYIDAPAGYKRTGDYTFESLCGPEEGTWQVRRTIDAPPYAPLEHGCFKVTCGDGRVEENEVCDEDIPHAPLARSRVSEEQEVTTASAVKPASSKRKLRTCRVRQ